MYSTDENCTWESFKEFWRVTLNMGDTDVLLSNYIHILMRIFD